MAPRGRTARCKRVVAATALLLLALGSKCRGKTNRSNLRAQGGIHSLPRQDKTRNRIAADHLIGKTRRKAGPGIRNLHPDLRRLNIKIIPAAARTTAPATMDITGRL